MPQVKTFCDICCEEVIETEDKTEERSCFVVKVRVRRGYIDVVPVSPDTTLKS